jgi:hypothetical protein
LEASADERDTRDFDYDHASVVGIHRELNIRPPRLDAYRPNHRKGSIAHDLKLFVGKRLDRRDSD